MNRCATNVYGRKLSCEFLNDYSDFDTRVTDETHITITCYISNITTSKFGNVAHQKGYQRKNYVVYVEKY